MSKFKEGEETKDTEESLFKGEVGGDVEGVEGGGGGKEKRVNAGNVERMEGGEEGEEGMRKGKYDDGGQKERD